VAPPALSPRLQREFQASAWQRSLSRECRRPPRAEAETADQKSEGATIETKPSRKKPRRGDDADRDVAIPARGGRAGSKQAQIIQLLDCSRNGVTRWQQHSLRGFFAGAVRKKLGLGLTLVSEKVGDERVYRIVSPDALLRPRTEHLLIPPLHERSSFGNAPNSDLLDVTEIPGHIGRVFADPHAPFGDEMIGRDWQIIWRRHAFEDTAGEVVFRAVTWAEIAAEPVIHRIV